MNTRVGFSSKLGFVAAAAGSAVGLGNIWQFPYITGQNGGGIFLIIYLAWVFIIGFPIMIGEIAIGRNTQKNPFGAFKKLGGKSWSYLGLFGILCGVMILSFYNVVAGWSFGYFIQLLFGDLLSQSDFASYFGSYVSEIGDNFFYSLSFMIITGIVVVKGIQKGIERASKILMPALFVILLGLIIYGLTLPNAIDGIKFYLLPDVSQVNGKTVYSALGQAFFSLSLGMGALITYGSYISRKENIVSSAIMVTVADSLVAFLAGLMIFPLVFSQGQSPGEGPGLVFVSLPYIFQSMNVTAGLIIGGLFFLLLCFAALTSTISLLEVPVSYITDEFKISRRKAVTIMASIIFLIGIPSMLGFGAVESLTSFLHYEGADKSFMDIVQDIFFVISLPLGGFLISVFIAKKWSTANLDQEVSEGFSAYINSPLRRVINIMIKYVCPTILGIMFLLTIAQKFFGLSVI